MFIKCINTLAAGISPPGVVINKSTDGTADTYIRCTLPITVVSDGRQLTGRENGVTGKTLNGNLISTTQFDIYNYDNTYPGGDSYVPTVSGVLRLV